MPPIEVTLTDQGYLHFTADVAIDCFPHDALVVTREGDALLLWPVRGVDAGGLLVKRRNAAGDRSVLIAEMLPAEAVAGAKIAEWDESRGVLMLSWLSLTAPAQSWRLPKDCVGITSLVVPEKGRWVVYLELGYWDQPGSEKPIRIERRRIADYPTERRATIAAEWMRRGADKSPGGELLGF
jgi:hypothetical protein